MTATEALREALREPLAEMWETGAAYGPFDKPDWREQRDRDVEIFMAVLIQRILKLRS